MSTLGSFQDQTPEQLCVAFEQHVVIERNSVTKTIAILVVMMDKRAHLVLGYPSLRQLCMRRFKLSRDEAKSRIAIARLVKRCPQVFEALEAGRITLSALLLMKNLINESNVEEMLGLGANKTKFEVEQLVASRDPKPPVEGTLKKIPRSESDVAAAAVPPGSGPGLVSPLAPDLYKLIATVTETCRGYIEEARDLMRHKIPSGDIGLLTEAAFKLLVEHLRKERFAETDKPRKGKPSEDPSYISNETKREVAARDGRQCSFVGSGGVRCTARGWLEFDHVVSRARGGKGDVEGVRLLCRAHHTLVTEQEFGREHVEKKIAEAEAARAAKRAAVEPMPAANGDLETAQTTGKPAPMAKSPAVRAPRRETPPRVVARKGKGLAKTKKKVVPTKVVRVKVVKAKGGQNTTTPTHKDRRAG